MLRPYSIEETVRKLQQVPEATVVLTGGVFDLFHVGHVRYLQRARQFGNYLVVHLDSDELVRSRKGNMRPIVPEQHRAEIVAALSFVDSVIVSDHRYDDPQVVVPIKPSLIVKNRRLDLSDEESEARILELGLKYPTTRVCELDHEDWISTTQIIQTIQSQAMNGI